jgi:hypothetical protein
MAQKTDTDLREIKDLIQALDKKIDSGLSDIKLELSDVKGELKLANSRLTTIEANVNKLDGRLWGFIGLGLTTTLGSLLTVFIRYMFWNNPKF